MAGVSMNFEAHPLTILQRGLNMDNDADARFKTKEVAEDDVKANPYVPVVTAATADPDLSWRNRRQTGSFVGGAQDQRVRSPAAPGRAGPPR